MGRLNYPVLYDLIMLLTILSAFADVPLPDYNTRWQFHRHRIARSDHHLGEFRGVIQRRRVAGELMMIDLRIVS